MRLIIRRNQIGQKSLLGLNKGVLFSLYFKVELSEEQNELVSKYRITKTVLTKYRSYDSQVRPEELTVIRLMRGVTSNVGNVTELLELENEVRKSCEQLKILLDVMKTFGGEEIVQY